MTRKETKSHRSHAWKRIFSYICLENMVMSLAPSLFLILIVFSQWSNATSVIVRPRQYSTIVGNQYDNNQMIYHQQPEYRAAEVNRYRSVSGIEDNYAALAAIAGVSLLTAAISVNMFAYHDGDMMKSLISPFGFGRTSTSTDVASNIPNLEATEGSYEDQGPIERIVDIADSWSRAIGMNECGQAAICEAHANNRDYGLLALPILFLFPGSKASNGYPASVWQEAALHGKARDSCSSRYSCIINPMWIVKFLMTTLVY